MRSEGKVTTTCKDMAIAMAILMAMLIPMYEYLLIQALDEIEATFIILCTVV